MEHNMTKEQAQHSTARHYLCAINNACALKEAKEERKNYALVPCYKPLAPCYEPLAPLTPGFAALPCRCPSAAQPVPILNYLAALVS